MSEVELTQLLSYSLRTFRFFKLTDERIASSGQLSFLPTPGLGMEE